MVKCWWFSFCCPSKFIKGCFRLHTAAILCSIQLQSATDVDTAFRFHWHLRKYFQTSGVSAWWTLSFPCRRLHTMPVQSRREMGSICRLTAGRPINRHSNRKQLENSQDSSWHDSHTCCIRSVVQVVNFGSKWFITHASVQHVTQRRSWLEVQWI